MEGNVLDEILAWSAEQPAWQRDALRRLIGKGGLETADVDDLTDLCKAMHGLSPMRSPEVLGKEHVALTGPAGGAPISLVRVTHHRGVNALANEQTVTFGPELTVVFGENAAGKSGYTRILKRACRSRSAERILGNLLSNDKPLKANATIVFQDGATETASSWSSEGAPAGPLAAISVFDSHCAPVYLRDKTDVAFRPFGLDIFDKLSASCGDVRQRLDAERSALSAAAFVPPPMPEGTRARNLVASLTSLTDVEGVQTLASLSKDEELRLKALRDRQRDLRAADPGRLAQELALKAQRIEGVARHLATLGAALGEAAADGLRSAFASLRSAGDALAALRKTALTPDLLPGTGEEKWRSLWEAAAVYSEVAYPGSPYPALHHGARCPFCQQEIQADARERLEHLLEYVGSTAQAEVRRTEQEYRRRLMALLQTTVKTDDIVLATTELSGDDPALAKEVTEFLDLTFRYQGEVKAAAEAGRELPSSKLTASMEPALRTAAKTLKDRSGQLRAQAAGLDPREAAELGDLEAREILRASLQSVLDEIERKKRIAAYGHCLEDVGTAAITRKSTELTKRLVTDQLRGVFQEELKRLQFSDLAVEIEAAGGAKGVLFHRLVFTGFRAVAVTDVLSEGESRTLSLAAFLTELSTAPARSSIIFDDPVSSLDHVWRERIATRLVEEAKSRQVIVFTHDLLFLRFLMDQATRQDVSCEHQYVRRHGQEAGRCSPDLPWVAMSVSKRIGVLRNHWTSADKLFRNGDPDGYERQAKSIYADLRETWEHAIGEILLADVVEPYRPSIETKKVRFLHDIVKQDCDDVEVGMTECSRWVHDRPAADLTPFPKPADLFTRIDDLDEWAKRIRSRREGSKAKGKK
jgi:hypothetical protein